MRRTIVTVAATGVLLTAGVALAGSAAAGGSGGKCHYEWAADGTLTSIACTGGTGRGDGTGGAGGRYALDQTDGSFSFSYGGGLGNGGTDYSPGGSGHHTVFTSDPLSYKDVGGGSPQP